ncbi:MAG: helix-turn-helix domain-containing protein [Limisphaerales bacterium]
MNELKNLSLEQLRRIVVIKEEIERLKVEMSCVAREDATAGSHSSFAIPARSHTAGTLNVRQIGPCAKPKSVKYIKHLFGMTLRDKRERIGFSQEELGFRARLHRTYICDIERGRRNVSLENIYKLALALRILPGELLPFASFTTAVHTSSR